MRHRHAIEREQGQDIGPGLAAKDYAETAHPQSPVRRVTGALRGLLALPDTLVLGVPLRACSWQDVRELAASPASRLRTLGRVRDE
jgi:hypothetical protein